MAARKKLQVFVSSTYQDLREERQAAVEAILTAGHIPAGMELFAAGDQSQMNVIQRWIDESDVYLLILGGRYGSIEPETGKSYTHLEYEYAAAAGKPLFAVVITEARLEEKVRTAGLSVVERENPQKLAEFRAQVMKKLVKFWSDPRDIKLAILETMADFGRRTDLVGWIPGDQAVNTGAVAEELARLARENAELRKALAQAEVGTQTYTGLSFDQLVGLLTTEIVELPPGGDEDDLRFSEELRALVGTDSRPTLLQALWVVSNYFRPLIEAPPWKTNLHYIVIRLTYYGVVRAVTDYPNYFELTPDGQRFILRIHADEQILVRGAPAAETETAGSDAAD